MQRIVPHYIGGKAQTKISSQEHAIYRPATGEVIAGVHFADQALCDAAIHEAQAAYSLWSETPPLKRVKVLFQFRMLLEKHQRELAELVRREHGKTIDDALGSVARALEVVDFHCGLLSQLQGRFSASVAKDIDCTTLRQPLGLCFGVSPFNFPIMVPVWMMIPALACGNAFILKPSELNPSAPIRLMELLTDAGLPDGVVQCLQGDKNTVEYLAQHPAIAAVTAVASTPVAKAIYTIATKAGKRAHTFGGAKNHAVLMPDADLKQAAQAIVGAAYGSAGQRCMALSVLVIVGNETADRFFEHFIPLVKEIRVGNAEEESVDLGPLISLAHKNRVLAAIDQGLKEGARLLIDGRSFSHSLNPEGFYLGPCLFDQVRPQMRLYQEEIFGPVLSVLRVENFEEALTLVNAHPYGNGTAIFTQNGYWARTYSQQVQVGMVGINMPIPVPVASHPFGGWKQSSFGDLGMHGEESIRFYTKSKTITSRWQEQSEKNSPFMMPSH